MQCQKGVFHLSVSLLCGFLLSACGGTADPESDVSQSSSSVANQPQACTTQKIPFSPLRRLTRFEYANSVRDLLNVDTSVVKDIPADEADGFDNNSALQVAPELLVEKYVLVSEALAAEAVKNLSSLTNCNPNFSGEQNCARQFARSFGRKAFRRPISSADESLFMSAYELGDSYQEGIELMIRMALQSPNFLYRLELGAPVSNQGMVPLDDFEIATRLAYFIWGTGPDDGLLDAAAAGTLSSKEQVAAKAREMLASPKARVSLTNFLEQWSDVRKLETMTKNTALFPKFSEDMREAMKKELPAFVDYMFEGGDVSLENLFTANVAFVSGPLADVYGVSAPFNSQTTPQMVTLPANQQRAGLLTQAGFLSVQGHPDQTSPVLRGKFIRANLLCDPPPPPPDNVDISVPELSAGVTARDRASIHLSVGGSCAGCHTLMDPIGLAFENFDAMGEFRLYEGGATIDVSGEVLFVDDDALAGDFVGVKELAGKLADSELVQNCVATQMFRFASGRYEAPGDDCTIQSIQDEFVAADGDIVELMVAVTQSDAFRFRSGGAQ